MLRAKQDSEVLYKKHNLIQSRPTNKRVPNIPEIPQKGYTEQVAICKKNITPSYLRTKNKEIYIK